MLDQRKCYFVHDTRSKLRLDPQQRHWRAARVVTMPSVYLDISITVHYIRMTFSVYNANRLSYLDMKFCCFHIFLHDFIAAVTLFLSGANLMGYLSRGWSTECNICFHISKWSSGSLVIKFSVCHLGKPCITLYWPVIYVTPLNFEYQKYLLKSMGNVFKQNKCIKSKYFL